MPPKAQATAPRGRPKKSAATEPAPTANASKKRGRVARTQDANEDVASEPPRKRGRPAKTRVEEAVVVEQAPRRGRRSNIAPADTPVEEEAPAPKKRVGRPPKKQTAAVNTPAAAPPKSRIGRPSKAEAFAAKETAIPKRRGPAAALRLSSVAGSPRVTKSGSKPTPSKSIAAPRLNPRMRSKLRTRQPPTPKVEQQVAPAPAKRRGRPPAIKPQETATPTQAKGFKGAQKAAGKSVAPRKKRGYTTIEVPDKFAAQVQQYFQDLVEADAVSTSDVEEEMIQVEEEDAGSSSAAAEEEEIIQAEDEDAGPGATAEEEEEEPVTIVDEETIITSATVGATDEEDVPAPADQIDGAYHSPEASDLNAAEGLDAMDVAEDIGSEFANSPLAQDPLQATIDVDVNLSIQETAQVEQDMINSADVLESALNDKENAFDILDTRLSSEHDSDAYIGGAAPGPSDTVLFGQELLSL
ncbi:hypothetical protein DE146DRAFT_10330 [Phaeosphaeria sp. MPI-PUGE-AT-0046c]|nr:hypothetical protein DE146DRAFT_10330 [Phaeosphaeria sp. MPI-PUGE-AT-0046c]